MEAKSTPIQVSQAIKYFIYEPESSKSCTLRLAGCRRSPINISRSKQQRNLRCQALSPRKKWASKGNFSMCLVPLAIIFWSMIYLPYCYFLCKKGLKIFFSKIIIIKNITSIIIITIISRGINMPKKSLLFWCFGSSLDNMHVIIDGYII